MCLFVCLWLGQEFSDAHGGVHTYKPPKWVHPCLFSYGCWLDCCPLLLFLSTPHHLPPVYLTSLSCHTFYSVLPGWQPLLPHLLIFLCALFHTSAPSIDLLCHTVFVLVFPTSYLQVCICLLRLYTDSTDKGYFHICTLMKKSVTFWNVGLPFLSVYFTPHCLLCWDIAFFPWWLKCH